MKVMVQAEVKFAFEFFQTVNLILFFLSCTIRHTKKWQFNSAIHFLHIQFVYIHSSTAFPFCFFPISQGNFRICVKVYADPMVRRRTSQDFPSFVNDSPRVEIIFGGGN